MSNLPDFEGLAVFAKVAERRSFAGAAAELKLSKATVSKAVSRLESKLGTRLAAPMSFGVLHLSPLIPAFLRQYPDVSIDLHLSDAQVDLIGEGFDAALRIAALPDSSLVARRLCDVPTYLLAAPSYLKAKGKPKHPLQLAEHSCIGYAYQQTPDTWRFRNKSGEVATVRPSGALRVNNGDAMVPALVAGLGFGVLPEFIVRKELKDGKLEAALTEWSLPSSALHWVTPPGEPRPARIEVLGKYLAQHLSRDGQRRAKSRP
jgi:DNA-binding transcriptional LysR family regulator